jgi:hypothetical protein
MTIPPALLHAQRQNLCQHAEAIRTAWAQVPAVPDQLRYEYTLGADTCTWIIRELRAVQTVVEQAAAYADHHPLVVSLQTRIALPHLADNVDTTIMHLVVLRATCREVSVTALRERKRVMQQFARLQAALERTLLALTADGQAAHDPEDEMKGAARAEQAATPEPLHLPDTKGNLYHAD